MIIAIKPKSELLRKHIMGFYMYKEREDFRFSYFAFPQLGSTLKIYRNAIISRSSTEIQFEPASDSRHKPDHYTLDIYGRYKEPLICTYKGYVQGFTINFNPIGINYFFDTPYKKLAPKISQEYSNIAWKKFSEELFKIKDFEKRTEFAEVFLEDMYNDIHQPELEKAIAILLKNPSIHIDELAKACCMSSRNLHRKFIRFVGCSTTVYKRIIRFRQSIDFNKWQKQNLNCTDVCYTNNFFDLSHLRKEFLKLTHQNPKDFFKTISAVGDHSFPYKLL